MTEFVLVGSYSEDKATYSPEDKTWKAIRKITQYRSLDGININKREFSVMAIDKDLDNAYKTTMKSILNKLQSVEFNLFAIENDPEINVITEKVE